MPARLDITDEERLERRREQRARCMRKRRADPERRGKVVQYQRNRRAQHIKWLENYKLEQGCIDCGRKGGHPAWYQFDHREPRDQKSISVTANVGFSRMQEELAKCDVRCLFCHAVRHHDAGDHRKRPRKYNDDGTLIDPAE